MIRRLAPALLLSIGAATCGAQTPGVEPPHAVTLQGTAEVAFAPWNDPEALLIQAIDEARTSIHVQAYLFTSKALAKALIAAQRRGVRVAVLLDAEMPEMGGLEMLSLMQKASELAEIPVVLLTSHRRPDGDGTGSMAAGTAGGNPTTALNAARKLVSAIGQFRTAPKTPKSNDAHHMAS